MVACVCACVWCVRAYACVCVCMRVYACVCVCMRVYACVCVCMRVYACVCVCMRVYACVCVCMRVYACVCVCMRVSTQLPSHRRNLISCLFSSHQYHPSDSLVESRSHHLFVSDVFYLVINVSEMAHWWVVTHILCTVAPFAELFTTKCSHLGEIFHGEPDLNYQK